MRIGIFGGTFDPIHTGHTQAAKICLTEMSLDQVLLMPSKNPVYKNTCLTDYAHLLKMCQLATAGTKGLGVSELERYLPGRAYTRDVLREFKRMHPDAALFLLMGREVFERLPHWVGAEEIMHSAAIVVLERAQPDADVMVTEIQPQRIYSLKAEFPRISSTVLRSRLNQRLNNDCWLCEAVANYIMRNDLYGV